jgi:hypothetical protein
MSIPAAIGLLLGFLKFAAHNTSKYRLERSAVHTAAVTGLLGTLGGLAGVGFSVMRLISGTGSGNWLLLGGGIITFFLCAIFFIIFIREEY